MTTLAVIPARLGATRLPRKPLRLLADKPLVIRVWERVRALRITDAVVIATDSTDVAAVAGEHGAACVLTSPGHPSGTDRVAEVALMDAYANADVFLNVQGDEPFVSSEALTGALALVLGGEFALATAAAP